MSPPIRGRVTPIGGHESAASRHDPSSAALARQGQLRVAIVADRDQLNGMAGMSAQAVHEIQRTAVGSHKVEGGDAYAMRSTGPTSLTDSITMTYPAPSAANSAGRGEHGDAPLRAQSHPFERLSASDLRLNDPGRELAIWYDPAQFPAGPVRFSLPEQGPACVLTVRGDGSIVERARIDGLPVVPGRSYVVEPGMRFEAPGAVDLQIRPAKPADLPGAPQGAG